MEERMGKIVEIQEPFERVSTVFNSVIAGDYALSRYYGFQISFEESGTKIFLDKLVNERPDVFKDKTFVIGLLEKMDRIAKYDKCTYDEYLDWIFLDYVDETLRNDKDVVICFINSFYSICLDSKMILEEYEPDIPDLCFYVSKDLLMEDEVFELILRNFSPVSIYYELLSDEERLDDELIYKILQRYEYYHQYRLAFMENYSGEKDRKFLFYMMQRMWIASIENTTLYNIVDYMFHDMEETDFIRKQPNGIYGFFKAYFSFLAERDFLKSYKGVEPKTLREKNDLYLQYLFDVNIAEKALAHNADAYKEDIYDSENPFIYKELMDTIQKYWYQICLFAAIGTENYNMFDDLRNQRINVKTEVTFDCLEGEDGYLTVPTAVNGSIPFI